MTEPTEKPSWEQQPEDQEKEQERADERALFARYQSAPEGAKELFEEKLVEKYRPLVYRIVHKFRFTPDQFDDLVQVGTMGLVLAIRRFDTGLNFRFSTYAWQTIQGEIQRYFRDKTWAVNVPRDLKEKSLKVFNAVQELIRQTGNDPTVSEVCAATGMSSEEVQEAMELGSAYHPQSFMDNSKDNDSGVSLSDEGGMASGSMDMSTTKRSMFWESLLKQLSEPEAQVVRLYFFDQRTQKEIADELETSQMNVSRITKKALSKLRGLIAPEDVENLSML